MNTKLIEIVEQLQKVAPEVWNAAVLDSYTSALGYAVWTAVFVLGAVGLRSITPTLLSTIRDDNDKVAVRMVAALSMGILFLNASFFGYKCLSRVISPELYAYGAIIERLQ